MIKRNILIVDDAPENIKKLKIILEEEYNIKAAIDGLIAWELLTLGLSIDLILLDINMPKMDGFELCRKIKKDNRMKDIPIIFITANNDLDNETKGFKLGASDFIAKPFNSSTVIARVKTHILLYLKTKELGSTIQELNDYKNNLEEKVKKSIKKIEKLNDEIISTQKEVIFTLGEIAECRSHETANHVKRVAEYSYLLARIMGLDEETSELLKLASPMHDIGKIGIPDYILNKPGKHTDEEFEIMKTHSKLGYEMLKHSSKPILKAAAIVAYEHHEKYDGTGYPLGLKGEEIHIFGRITAVSDVYDALNSNRCYKKAWSKEKILNFLKIEKDKHFCPKVINAFFESLDLIYEIERKFPDKNKKQLINKEK